MDVQTIELMANAVARHLGRCAERKGTENFVNAHHALGVLTEEYHELVEAVQCNNPDAIASELLDVAVAALWGLGSMMSQGDLECGDSCDRSMGHEGNCNDGWQRFTLET